MYFITPFTRSPKKYLLDIPQEKRPEVENVPPIIQAPAPLWLDVNVGFTNAGLVETPSASGQPSCRPGPRY